MEEYIDTDYINAFEVVNNDIAEQNNRLNLSSQITDDEFRALAVTGLSVEQQGSVAFRSEITESFDYAAILSHWETVLDEKSQVHTRIEAAHASKFEISKQAELSLSIAPNSSQEIQRLTESKLSVFDNEIQELEASILGLQEKELGFVAVCQPWAIPLVSPANHESVPSEQQAEEATVEAVASAEEIGIEEAQLKRVLWAVFDYASKADALGVRLEEMRKLVPELAELSKADYKFFKGHFSEMRTNIVDMLDGMGYRVEWATSGRTRGTRYHVREVTKRNTPMASKPVETPPVNTQAPEPKPEVVQEKPEEQEILADQDGQEPTQEVTIPVAQNAFVEESEDDSIELPQSNTNVQVAERDVALEKEGTPTFHVLKNVTGASHTSGMSTLVEVSIDDVARHLNIKKDPQYIREVKKWINWLAGNPRSVASRKIRSYAGIRLERGDDVVPLFRFSPKDAVGLPVPRQYMRHRVVYTLVGNIPAVVDVLDHDSFDRKYN